MLIYLVLIMLSFPLGWKIYKTKINPITIYGIIWGIVCFLYSLHLIDMYTIGSRTICILITTHFIFIIGAWIGVVISRYCVKVLIPSSNHEQKIKLKYSIIFFCVLAAIQIIPKLVSTVMIYGINYLSYVVELYNDQLTQNNSNNFGLSAFIYAAIALDGVYVCKYKFEKFCVFPLILSVLSQFGSGSRGTFISIILIFLGTFCTKSEKIVVISKKEKKKYRIILVAMIIFVVFVTFARSSSSTTIYYTKGLLSRLPQGNVIARVITYICGGIGCLDQYLKNPVRNDIPKLFLRVPILFTNALGFTNINTDYRGITYNIPFSSNVLTIIGELYMDFGEWFYLVIFVLAIIFSASYCKFKNREDITDGIVFSVIFVIFVLSFFCYFGRIANLWYALIFGLIASMYIKYIKIRIGK